MSCATGDEPVFGRKDSRDGRVLAGRRAGTCRRGDHVGALTADGVAFACTATPPYPPGCRPRPGRRSQIINMARPIDPANPIAASDMSRHCHQHITQPSRNGFGRLRARRGSGAVDSSPASRRHQPARALALRCVLSAAVLLPAAMLTIMLGQPFAISAIGSTTAIVLHAPSRYHQRPQRILSCYAAGVAISVPISLAGAAVGLPTLLASAISAVIIAASLPGKVHPPTVCIPLAITAPSIQLVALIGRWLCFTGLALVCLAVLWLLTAPPLAQNHSVVAGDRETPCPAES
ncbi:hypothetical protein C8E89_13527 [Mycolicibacterium moriokaense]|uniref:HPP family protein n=1 Tax=Mycolicibacterium moriokaense TaxID=39691 RepID=A0A318H6S4_9MYCO|nr:hypothetical protein C8E89_13527 [Mycolicibacterium moriokaense]